MSAPKIITEWGYTTESMRLQAVANMKEDPAKRQAVLELLCQQLGSVAKGEMEMMRRYPELFEDKEK
jgi:hypothetical protein